MLSSLKTIFVLLVLICAQVMRAGGILENDPNLVLHYDFETQPADGTVVDTSSFGNNGIQYNTTNFLSYTNGSFGGMGAQFTCVGGFGTVTPLSQYIAVTNLQGFAVMTNATISVWLQFDQNTNKSVVSILDCGYNYALISNSTPSASNCWSFGRYGNSDPALTFWVYPNGGPGLTGNGALKILTWPNNGINFSTTTLHLYTATIDCVSNIATAYFDGVPYTNNPVGVPFLRIYGCRTLRWLCVGASCHNGTPQWADSDNYPNDGYFAGRMDDVRIYNRTLSASEVKAIYQAARSVTITPIVLPQVQISWRGQSNVSYQVETCIDLLAQAWSAVGQPIPSLGGLDSTPAVATNSSAFYRVRPTP